MLPTGQAALDQDPGYALRLKEGEGALENSATARHFANTGATLKDILKELQTFNRREDRKLK